MAAFGAKALYTIALLAVAAFCLREAWVVWFDRALHIGTFVATKDGSDSASMADAFRRLVVQHQKILFDLYSAADYSRDIHIIAAADLPIRVVDLVRMPESGLGDLKIEAAGVNVTSVLATLRRWIVAPNEITGSIDQIGSRIYVSAEWPDAPEGPDGAANGRSFLVPPQIELQAAALDLASRLLFARVVHTQAVFKSVTEDDFCTFTRGLLQFRDYVTAHNAASGTSEAKAANDTLDAARRLIDGLVTAKSKLIYAYKLAGYIELETVATTLGSDAAVIKPHLDRAQSLLTEYLKQLSALVPEAHDRDAQEKLASLATREAAVQVADTLRPGASISPADSKTANTVGFFVTSDGKRYLLSSGYSLNKIGATIVSPAIIDTAKTRQTIGQLVKSDGPFALIELSEGLKVANDPINGLGPSPAVGAELRAIGRSGSELRGKVRVADADDVVIDTNLGTVTLNGVIMAESLGVPGDGGSAVVDGDNRLVGMLLGSSPAASVIIPIKSYFDREHLTLLR